MVSPPSLASNAGISPSRGKALLFAIFFFEEHCPLEGGHDRLERFPLPEQFANPEDVVYRDDHQFWVR